jgi:hypothetical protein
MIQLEKNEFCKFLNGEINISDFEIVIYQHQDWGERLGEKVYFELVNFDFQDKNSGVRMREFILENIVKEREFQTWKLKSLLHKFLSDVQNMPQYLEKCYDLYCGIVQNEGNRKYRYRFLGNLGLNYFYWKDEDYLNQQYGQNWKIGYDKVVKDFEFYHNQLKPMANEILLGLENGDIQILNDGQYIIEDSLRTRLETDGVFKLEHPGPKNCN